MKFFRAHDTKRVFKHICEQFDLVYFGSVSQHADEHQMVRGFTLSPSHTDRHYCVGTVAHRDLILLERTDTISFPDKPSRPYTWTILQIDLAVRVPAHIILNSHQYDDIVYRRLFTALHTMRQADATMFAGHDPTFVGAFRVYSAPQQLDHVVRLLPPDTTSVLGHHFAGFDYELSGERLLVYYPTAAPTATRIELMSKAGIWLAGEIEKIVQPTPADHMPYNDGRY